jgi:hypothetical protein
MFGEGCKALARLSFDELYPGSAVKDSKKYGG